MSKSARQRATVYATLAALLALGAATAKQGQGSATGQHIEAQTMQAGHATSTGHRATVTAPATPRSRIYYNRAQRFARNAEAA